MNLWELTNGKGATTNYCCEFNKLSIVRYCAAEPNCTRTPRELGLIRIKRFSSKTYAIALGVENPWRRLLQILARRNLQFDRRIDCRR